MRLLASSKAGHLPTFVNRLLVFCRNDSEFRLYVAKINGSGGSCLPNGTRFTSEVKKHCTKKTTTIRLEHDVRKILFVHIFSIVCRSIVQI